MWADKEFLLRDLNMKYRQYRRTGELKPAIAHFFDIWAEALRIWLVAGFDIIPYRKAVQAGDTTSVTLRLYNQSPTPALNSEVELVLDEDLNFVSFYSGVQSPIVNEKTITWYNLNIPASNTLEFVFLVQVTEGVDPSTQLISFSGEAYDVCFGQPKKGDHFAGDGKSNLSGCLPLHWRFLHQPKPRQ